MKKLIIMAIAVITFTNVNAQEKSFGGKVGLNIANLTGTINNVSETTNSKVGFNVGLFGEFKFKEFAVQPEVLFSRVGGKSNNEENSGGFTLNYISIPLMFKFYPVKQFSLEAGPQISFLTSSTFTFGNQSLNANELYNVIDFGINIGMNYNFTDKVFANVRYNFGLSNIASDSYRSAVARESGTNSNNVEINNSYFQIGLGFKY